MRELRLYLITNSLFQLQQVHYIKMSEYIKIRRGEAMLVLSLIREHFPEFNKLSSQNQVY